MHDERVREVLKLVARPIYTLGGDIDINKGWGWGIVGFDTEYSPKQEKTICYQLYVDDEHQKLIPGPKKLTIREIVREAKALLPAKTKKILITSYYNTAELSQMAEDFWKDPNLKMYPAHPSGVMHLEGEEDGCKFFFFDLWHWFASMPNSSLYGIAKEFGYEKVDWYRKGETHEQSISTLRASDLRSKSFRLYAMHDARLCVQIFNTLQRTYDATSGVSIISRPTPANAAQASFRQHYLREKVNVPQYQIRRMALECNWGGRAECGFVGPLGGVFEFDADSLYPRSTLLLPNLPGPGDWQFKKLPTDLQDCEGFIDLDFEFKDKEEVWPNLPVYDEGSLIFPLKGRSRCTIGELRAAMQRDGFTINQIWKYTWYKTGTHDEFHKFIQDQLELKRANNNNPAIRAVAKLNMNSSIGKFVQNKGGFDMNLTAKYLRDKNITEAWEVKAVYDGLILPDREWLVANGIDPLKILTWNHRPVRLGSSFYPEWHSLILGKAREQISRAVYDNPVYPECLAIATDALYIRSDRISGREAVPFKLERGPMVFKSFRTRRHLSTDSDGKILAAAHHGMPMPTKDAAFMMALSEHKEKVVVSARGFNTVRESIHKDVRFGGEKQRSITVSFEPDNKRRTTDSGWTMPWGSLGEMNEAL